MPEIPKANCVIADNWSLQAIAQALSGGLEMGEASLIHIEGNTRLRVDQLMRWGPLQSSGLRN